MENNFNRRDFLKLSVLGSTLIPSIRYPLGMIGGENVDYPHLGRVVAGKAELKIKPDYDSKTVGVLYEDAIVPWLQEVVGYWPYRNNQRWIETPDGYLWCPQVQPVNLVNNAPVSHLPTNNGIEGMWVEVTVPWVNGILINNHARSAWLIYRLEHDLPPRFYFSQILWVDQVKIDDNGKTWYRINERYGNPGDLFWAPAEAFRQIQSDELTPISPDVEDKKIVVDANYNVQTLSCFEGNNEVYFCRVSTGVKEGSTPVSPYGSSGYPIWRKLYSTHMAGGTNAAGWDLPGIGWTSLFIGNGVAIHSTYWHNNFGEPMSHGCVNAKPDDAKWIFRWTQPLVPTDTGDITISGSGSTRVIVNEW